MSSLADAPSFTLRPRATVPILVAPRVRSSFPEPVLAGQALWLCKLRWLAVGILVTFGAAGLVTDHVESVDLVIRSDWPLVTAAILFILNSAFILHIRYFVQRGIAGFGAAANIVVQIACDLIAHTIVLHFLGSLETYAAFIYLFHIVLSCMFLSRRQSLLIAVSACLLYAACFALEATGMVSHISVYGAAGNWTQLERVAWPTVFNIASAMAILLVAWYVASHMTSLVRARDAALQEANRLLRETQEAKTKHLLRTTHELKAPFAAIHANAQLLLKGYCGAVSEEANGVLEKIAARCRRLAREIQSMLQLANLRSAAAVNLQPADLNVEEVVEASTAHVLPIAEERKITIERDIMPTTVRMEKEHLRMMLDNLLSNAVVYSYEGGVVRVECAPSSGGMATLIVEDHGIGIKEEKLPHIFEEYYRTDEAGKFNKQSSGLGLAIVEDIVRKYGIDMRVESRLGEGTRVIVKLPQSSEA